MAVNGTGRCGEVGIREFKISVEKLRRILDSRMFRDNLSVEFKVEVSESSVISPKGIGFACITMAYRANENESFRSARAFFETCMDEFSSILVVLRDPDAIYNAEGKVDTECVLFAMMIVVVQRMMSYFR